MPTYLDHPFDYDYEEYEIPERDPRLARIVLCDIIAAAIAATIVTVMIVIQRT